MKVPLLYMVKPEASTILSVFGAGVRLRTVTSLRRSALAVSSGAYKRKDGSTYKLEPLHRILASPFSQIVEKIKIIMPTNLPSLSITYP